MAVSSHGEASPAAAASAAASDRDDADFVRDSYLAYMVPLATDSKLEQALEQCDGSLQAFIESVEDREWLFFDETVDVYFLLRTPYQGDKALRAYLDRLAVSLEAQIVNSSLPGRDSAPVVETIFNGAVESPGKPLAVVHDPETDESETEDEEGEDEDESEDNDDDDNEEDDEGGGNKKKINTKPKKDRPVRQTYIVWKLPVFLARPRARLQRPSVSFSAMATLGPRGGSGKNSINNKTKSETAGYLQSRSPSGLNLLESFIGDPALAGVRPRLSAQRVSRVAPAGLLQQQQEQQARSQTRVLRGLKAVQFPVFPAVHARVRFARPNAVPAGPAVVAMLEIDCTPFFECEAVLTHINLEVAGGGGTVTDLNTADGLALPLYCVARDHFTFLYRLTPSQHYEFSQYGGSNTQLSSAASASSLPRELKITIELKALVKPGVCTPTMKLSWATGLDFVPPVNPGFGSAVPAASMQRAHRPSQLSIDGMASFVAPAVSRPDSLQMMDTAGAGVVSSSSSSSHKNVPAPLSLHSPASAHSPLGTTTENLPDLGITMTFSAPDHPVYAGQEFCWTVFVVNRSGGGGGGVAGAIGGAAPLSSAAAAASGTADGVGGGTIALAPPTPLPPRKLALLVLPKRRRNDVRVIRPPSTARRSMIQQGGGGGGGGGGGSKGALPPSLVPGSTTTTTTATTTGDVADAVLDENIVHAMQRSSLVGSTDVVSVTADARVGPLAPNACHVVELRFVALRAGLVNIEAVRVVDLGSQEHVDVRELPVMLIGERRGAASE